MHLAQINIACAKTTLDGPELAGFRAELDRINAVADACPGFVWRFQDETGHAMDVRAFDDPRVAINMSVWETPQALERFVWNTVHVRIYGRRDEWFEQMESHHMALWWVEEGHVPTPAEGVARLAHRDAHGETDHAFGWSHLKETTLWETRRCA